jgi:hypothetical protein
LWPLVFSIRARLPCAFPHNRIPDASLFDPRFLPQPSNLASGTVTLDCALPSHLPLAPGWPTLSRLLRKGGSALRPALLGSSQLPLPVQFHLPSLWHSRS